MPIVPDELLAVAALFRQACGNDLQPHDLNAIGWSRLRDISPDLLAQDLIELITSDNGGRTWDRGMAYWVLGTKRDEKLVPFFLQQLRIELTRDMNCAYQIMIALEDVDEEVFSDERSSYSFDEDDLNRRDAVAYLADKE